MSSIVVLSLRSFSLPKLHRVFAASSLSEVPKGPQQAHHGHGAPEGSGTAPTSGLVNAELLGLAVMTLQRACR